MHVKHGLLGCILAEKGRDIRDTSCSVSVWPTICSALRIFEWHIKPGICLNGHGCFPFLKSHIFIDQNDFHAFFLGKLFSVMVQVLQMRSGLLQFSHRPVLPQGLFFVQPHDIDRGGVVFNPLDGSLLIRHDFVAANQ